MHLNITLCKWKTTPWSNVFSISPRNTLFGFPKEQKKKQSTQWGIPNIKNKSVNMNTCCYM